METPDQELTGPDFERGVPIADVPDGVPFLGHARGEQVLLVRRDGEFSAVGALCTHYSGPLSDGIILGEEIRCPWHHARFHLGTGEAIGPPALNPVPCYRVEVIGENVFVREKKNPPAPSPARPDGPESVLIIGAGAAGNAAAETLRREGYSGRVLLIDAGDAPPVDRPNLSKDYLAGSAREEWISLRDSGFYREQGIELKLNARAISLDTRRRSVSLADGTELNYGALILATGADPIRLSIPGADLPHVHTLRSLADSRAIIRGTAKARTVVLAGASFIALEVAAALRARGLDIHLVAPESRPLERILGSELGAFVQSLHESHGAVFHPGRTIHSIDTPAVTLDDGTTLKADLVVIGVGVRPATSLAAGAGLTIDRGVTVNEYLETSAPGVYAAGDIARWPDPHSGLPLRVEHWVVAERQGQVAARNAMGLREAFRAIPFFWSQHYDIPIAYVGHAELWQSCQVYGNIAERDCAVAYRQNGRVVAVASIYRDRESLAVEAAMERDDQQGIEEILAGIRSG